jgi:hypothetical protein
MSDDKPIESFEEFWPYYVLEHRKPETQALHAVGTSLGLVGAAAALATRRPWLIPLGLVGAYGMAWYSHYRIEENRPATFKYPLYSFAADFKMFGKILRGKMSQEVQAALALREAQKGTIEMEQAEADPGAQPA